MLRGRWAQRGEHVRLNTVHQARNNERLLSQSRMVVAALDRLLAQALVERLPADRALASWLREHREFGSRDRRLVSESVYAVFRWWGWLRRLAPHGFHDPARAEAASPRRRYGEDGWERLLLAAHVLEGLAYEDILALWAGILGLSPEAAESALEAVSAEERAERVFRLFGENVDASPLALAGLVPDWAPAEMECPREIRELVSWLQRRPPLWLRMQQPDREAAMAELAAAGLHPARHSLLTDAVRVDTRRVNLYALPAYREGRVEVQDLASQSVGRVCAPAPGQRWWDACAGGGGKTLLLAQLMGGKGAVVASDVREGKLRDLRLRARRGRFPNIRTREWDGSRLPADKATFDGVLVDAPCTGSGTWRRNPAARWSLRHGEIAEMAALQSRILRAAAAGVKPGGVLVYATCSLFRKENAEVVSAFLAESPQFAPEPFAHPFSRAPIAGMTQIWPWDGDCDAMFIARLRRRGAVKTETSNG